MLSYAIVQDNPKLLQALTTLEPAEFERLLVAFDAAWQKHQAQTVKPERKRRLGGGRKPKLNDRADQLLFILFYLKLYPLQIVQGFLFGLSQAQANEWIHRLSAVLELALNAHEYLPERAGDKLPDATAEQADKCFVQDGCERRRQRPLDAQQQREYYSGKKKTHTLKNHLVVHPDSRQVTYLSATVSGRTHDKKLADQSALHFPRAATVEQDTGFQGYEASGAIIVQPKKKPRKQELTAGEKFLNRCISSGRIIVENVIAGVKRCRIVKAVFRNWKAGFDDTVMLLACGLHNFRTASRHSTTTVNLLELYSR